MMIRLDNLPDYYDTMYQDGFEPWQIYEAFHRTARERITQQRDGFTVNVVSNVEVEE